MSPKSSHRNIVARRTSLVPCNRTISKFLWPEYEFSAWCRRLHRSASKSQLDLRAPVQYMKTLRFPRTAYTYSVVYGAKQKSSGTRLVSLICDVTQFSGSSRRDLCFLNLGDGPFNNFFQNFFFQKFLRRKTYWEVFFHTCTAIINKKKKIEDFVQVYL